MGLDGGALLMFSKAKMNPVVAHCDGMRLSIWRVAGGNNVEGIF